MGKKTTQQISNDWLNITYHYKKQTILYWWKVFKNRMRIEISKTLLLSTNYNFSNVEDCKHEERVFLLGWKYFNREFNGRFWTYIIM